MRKKDLTKIFCALDRTGAILNQVNLIRNNGCNLPKEAFQMMNPLFTIMKAVSFLKKNDLEIFREIKQEVLAINHNFNNINREKIEQIAQGTYKIQNILFDLIKA